MKIDAIYADIVKQLSKGVWREGEQLPTERTLAEQYGVSRPTIGRVLNKLRDEGKLRRVVGSGSYLMKPEQPAKTLHKKLGLFVPGLGKGEIFEPICARIAELSRVRLKPDLGERPAEQPDALPDKLLQTARRFVELDLEEFVGRGIGPAGALPQIRLKLHVGKLAKCSHIGSKFRLCRGRARRARISAVFAGCSGFMR